MLSHNITKKKTVKIFSDGSMDFCYTIIKRSKKVNYSIKDNKNLFLNQKTSKFGGVKKTNFKLSYLR